MVSMAEDKQSQVMKDLQGFFRQGQREAIYNSCKTDRDKLLVRLLWKTGRRITEVLLLKASEVDFENANILWHIEKKKKEHLKWKPIDKNTLLELKQYIQKENIQPEEYIFQSSYKEDKPITRQRAFQIIRIAAEDSGVFFVGIKKPHPHHFRHSFAVDKAKILKSPADIRKLQMIMEHSNLNMTEQYLQFSDQDLRTLIDEED